MQQVSTLVSTDEAIRHLIIETDVPERYHSFGDADQLHRVLLNLIRNAADAIGPDRGRITIGARMIDDSPPSRLTGPQRRLEVFIVDDGPGMPPEVLRNLFIPFFTTKRQVQVSGLLLPAHYAASWQ